MSIGYYDGDGITSAKSARVETITNGDETLTYTYDDRGYITRVEKDANNYSEYRYDALGQIVRENYKWGFISYTVIYAHDVGGNIAQKDKYEFVAGDGDVVTLIDSIAYTYDATWKDKLASYDGDSITYDDIGNPLNDGTWTYTWTQGRKLSAISGGMTSASYKYNNSGIRTQKSVGGVTTVFNLAGDNITWQKTGTGTPIYFIYDSAGKLWGLNYEGNTYFYVRNAQGDIIKIVDNTGAVVVEYAYDAWGNLLMTSDSSGVSLGTANPFRYRGYYYDAETGLYYLNARYYNPRWGRFINADTYGGSTGALLSHNVFAYCYNSPVVNSDPSGNWVAEGISLRDSVFLPDVNALKRKIKNRNYTLNDIYMAEYLLGYISYDQLTTNLGKRCHVQKKAYCCGPYEVYDKNTKETLFYGTGYVYTMPSSYGGELKLVYILENDPVFWIYNFPELDVPVGRMVTIEIYGYQQLAAYGGTAGVNPNEVLYNYLPLVCGVDLMPSYFKPWKMPWN